MPFQASQSRLLRLVRHAEEPHMPEKKPKLPEPTLRAIAEWIDLGAPFDKPLVEGRAAPRDASVVSTADKAWWSFWMSKRIRFGCFPAPENETCESKSCWIKNRVESSIVPKPMVTTSITV